jgi:hypothetical protein
MAALTDSGFSTSLCSDAVFSGRQALRINIPANSDVVYRGWMVKSEEYAALTRAIEASGAKPFTDLNEYLSTHHLPNWHSLLSDLTPETRVYPQDADIIAELQQLNWDRYFLKDFVKSLKTSRGSVIHDPSEAPAIIAEMLEYRGEIEGGLCVRRYEDFIPESEQRYFVLEGIGYSASDTNSLPDIFQQCSERICSKFFSVDVVQRRDGELRVVEIGDGQVSDLVGWTPSAFASMWLRADAVRRESMREGP